MTVFRNALTVLAGCGALMLLPTAGQAADYQVYKDANCAPNAQCGINFAKVQAGKKLSIDNVSCYLRFGISDEVFAAQVVVVNQNGGSRAFAMTPSLRSQDTPMVDAETETQVFVSNDTIRAVAKPNQFFRIYAQVHTPTGAIGTISQWSCGISGTLN